MKILIAEDDPVSCLVLERTLQRWGFQVITTKNGEEAWDYYQYDPVPMVITDWMMPQMDGLELCRRIRSFKQEPYTYLIVLTAKSQKSEMVEGMNAGADDFVTKPFDSPELYARIRAGERVLDLEVSLTEGQREARNVNSQLQKSIERQNLINQLLRALTASLDFDVVMREAVAPLRQLFNSSRAFVRLIDAEKQLLRLIGEHCAPDVMPMGTVNFPIEKTHDVKDCLYNSRRASSHLLAELDRDLRVSSRIMTNGFGVQSLLCEPLMHQGIWFGDIGLHQCDRTRVWTDEEIQLLNTIAQQMSVVAANAELHRRVQEQSVRDSLTGLFNRRHFDYVLDNEFERASRYRQELSLAIIDMDFLKRINDEMGHQAGDSAIRQTGAILAKQSRRVDIATRYGGEEFAVILPQTSTIGARAAAEHWRKSINHCLVGDIRLSASIGIATYPNHTNTVERLISAADAALYQAKNDGRNRVREAVVMEMEAKQGR